jgi:hypothetical protein
MADWNAEILRAYRDILGREPEAGAVQWMLSQIEAGVITTVSQLRQNFRDSPEAAAVRVQQVQGVYRDVLGRDADEAGLANWSEALRNGTYDNVNQLRDAIRLSPEATARGTESQRGARATVQALLDDWGLSTLGDWAWDQIRSGNTEQIPQLIRQTEQYKQRFSGLEARRAKGLNVMSESQYLQLENDYRSLLSRYGIPSGIFDTQQYLGTLIAEDLSPNELNDRLRLYQDAAINAPAETRASLQRLYGVNEGGLTAFFIDPDRALPVLEAQYGAAQVASAAERAGFATFGAQIAERLYALGAGGNDTQVFETLDRSRELFNPLGFTEGGLSLSEDQAAEAAFGGNAEGSETMRKRAEGRVAEFSGGGGFTQSNRGVTGLGSGST